MLVFPKGFSKIWSFERAAAVPPASSRWRGVDAHPPHEQGAGVLRCGSVGAVVGIDGGRLRSRSLPPAAG